MGDGFAQCRTVTRMRLTPKDRKAILTMPAPVTLLLRPDGYGIEGHRGTTFPNTCRIRPGKALRLTVARLPSETPASHAGTLRDLAANGVVLIGNPPASMNIPTVPTVPQTPFDTETASVTARRAVWGPATSTVPVTAVICSNRPDRLPEALAKMAAQTHTNLQVIVVLHGTGEAAPALQTLDRLPPNLVVMSVPAGVLFGKALTAGALLAEGDFVTKVDDDDYYGPDHITDLLIARSHSGAQLVGKALQYVYLEAVNVTARQDGSAMVSDPETYGTWTCGGTLGLDRATGNELGWFDSIERAVDRNLQDKILRANGRIYRTHGLGYLYVRHGDGHTYGTSWPKYLRNTVEQRTGPWPSSEFGQTTTDTRPAQGADR